MPFERVKHLRKQQLHLTQQQFADRLHITRSNLGSLETGRIRLTDRLLHDICREWSVNAEWLEHGTMPIFKLDDKPSADDIIEIYEALSPDNKKYLRGYIHRLLEEQSDE